MLGDSNVVYDCSVEEAGLRLTHDPLLQQLSAASPGAGRNRPPPSFQDRAPSGSNTPSRRPPGDVDHLAEPISSATTGEGFSFSGGARPAPPVWDATAAAGGRRVDAPRGIRVMGPVGGTDTLLQSMGFVNMEPSARGEGDAPGTPRAPVLSSPPTSPGARHTNAAAVFNREQPLGGRAVLPVAPQGLDALGSISPRR